MWTKGGSTGVRASERRLGAAPSRRGERKGAPPSHTNEGVAAIATAGAAENMLKIRRAFPVASFNQCNSAAPSMTANEV